MCRPIVLKPRSPNTDRTRRGFAAANAAEPATIHAATQLKRRLDNALGLVEHCHTLYTKANAKHRRMLNQGFFRMIYIGEDGAIQSAVVDEPFAGLLAVDSETQIVTDFTPDDESTPAAPSTDTPGAAVDLSGLTLTEAILRIERSAPRNTAKPHVNNVRPPEQIRRALAFAPGWNNNHLAELPGQLSKPGAEAARLLTWWHSRPLAGTAGESS